MAPLRPISLAASLRLVLGLVALLLLPAAYPGLAAFRGVFIAYLAWSAFAQVLIWRRIGGNVRAVIDGVVDLLVLTFVVHRVGSVANVINAVYVVAVVLNVLVVGRRVGFAVAVTAALMYSATVLAEALGYLPYAPDAPTWAHGAQPNVVQALFAAGLISMVMLLMAAMVGMLVRLIREREAELLEANAQLEALSQQDPLTKLHNRRHLLRRIEEELAWLPRGRPMAVIMLDLDGFKRINDVRGHLEGDALLRTLSETLAQTSRVTDVAGRFGGDEFLVVLPDTTPEEAPLAAERLRKAVAEAARRFDPDRVVTASVGVSYARPDDTPDEIIRRADESAYVAKQQGGNAVVVDGVHRRPDTSRESRPVATAGAASEGDPCAS